MAFTRYLIPFLCLGSYAAAFISTTRASHRLVPQIASSLLQHVPEMTYDEIDGDGTLPEFAAITPGCQVEVQVGNVDLARKAWKKRRRTGSPLLIPCSVLNTERKSMVIKNLIFMLQRHGRPISEQKMNERPFGFKSKDLAISMSALKKYYKKNLHAHLENHALALGYTTVPELLKDVFNEEFEKVTGIKFWSVDGSNWLVSRMSKMRGQRLSAQAALLQFVNDDGTMMHTGMMRLKSSDEPRLYELKPLSAALRVSQRALDAGLISDGSRHTAFISDIDPMGDGGCPLLKVSLDVAIKKKNSRRRVIIESSEQNLKNMKNIDHDMSKIKVGDGPFVGKVVRLSRNPKAALIDIGMGRGVNGQQKRNEGIVRVLGMLKLDRDATKSNKGKRNSNTEQRKEILDSMGYYDDDEAEPEHEGDVDIDFDFSSLNVEEFFDEVDDEVSSPEEKEEESALEKNRSLKEGDEVEVYIQAISKQSGKFLVTTESQVQKMKEVKKEAKAHKNLERLLTKFNGSAKNVMKWKGTEGIGTVKAKSQTGSWMYVQPQFNDLPVGIAQLSNDISSESFSVGDSVQVRLDGIDKSRGQLSLTVVGKA